MIVYRNQYGSFVNSERIGRERERERGLERERKDLCREKRGSTIRVLQKWNEK